jgi:hypothetical protein
MVLVTGERFENIVTSYRQVDKHGKNPETRLIFSIDVIPTVVLRAICIYRELANGRIKFESGWLRAG